MNNIKNQICLIIGILLVCLPHQSLAGEIDFQHDIAPILEDRCTYCHGEDEQESGLRLDLRASMLRGGDSGLAAVVPGEPDKSYLIDVINHVDQDITMPPDEDKLPANEIDLFVRWIEAGAHWPGQMEAIAEEKSDHWSFQPVVRPAVPKAATNASNPIDAYLLESLASQGLSFSDRADPRSLIRRASIVLTGIAPTPEETNDFIAASAQDSNQAYAALVERLLDSPHFGERWAQHWLDVIRWAETNGSESNMYRKNAWIYRDYVIHSFNEDKPYDQFLFEQIAGDTVQQGDATGFLVAGPHVPLATVGREAAMRRQARADRMDEILQTVGASALGMTIGCARCHNHKFDPISISDYYSMSAVFQDIEFGSRFPEYAEDHPRRLRGKQLNGEIRKLRRELIKMGPWEEDWKGYTELQFPATTTKSVRISFQPRFVRLDELEVYGTEQRNKNLALAAEGTITDHSYEITDTASPISRINDGQYGNDSWVVRVQKDSQERAWVQFTFQQSQEVNRIRLSTNRREYLETDYQQSLNEKKFEPFKVEVQTPSGQWNIVAEPSEWNNLNDQHPQRAATLRKLHELISQVNNQGRKPSFIARLIRPASTYVLGRGSPENPRQEVFAAGLSELGGDLGLPPNATGKQRRAAFAKWLTAADHPLTSRVAANRLWHHVFGQGIVTTASDFGAAGAAPSHPELLDWLAAELMQSSTDQESTKQRWSLKHLIRLMVTTEAFQQSSLPNSKALAIDAGSALLWRFPPKRMEAEVIRDSVLQASGLLNRTLGGRSFRIHNVKKRYAQWQVIDNYGPKTWRRMIYQERMRRVDDQMFTAFDFPDCGQVRAKRPVSTTPLQALNLMNSDFVIDQAKRIAVRAKSDTGGDEVRSIDRCFELLLGRAPDDQEREACLELIQDRNLALVCRALINSNEFAFLP